MNEKRGVNKSWAMCAVGGAVALVLGLAVSGGAAESRPSTDASIDGAQLAAVLGVPIGPRLGIVPKHEVGRGDTGAATSISGDELAPTPEPAPARVEPVTEAAAEAEVPAAPAAPADGAASLPEVETLELAAAGPSGIDALRDRFPVTGSRTAAGTTPDVASDAAPAPVVAETPVVEKARVAAAPITDRRSSNPARHRRTGRSSRSGVFSREARTETDVERAAPVAEPETLAIPAPVAPAPVAEPKPEPVSIPEVEPAPVPAPVLVVSRPEPQPAPVQLAMNTAHKPHAAPTEPAPRQAAAAQPAAERIRVAQAEVQHELPMPRSQSASHTPVEGATVHSNPPSAKIAARGAGRRSRPNIMRVLVGKSLLIDLKSDAKRVSVANPEVAEVLVVTPRQVMINGLDEGETSIIIWDRAGNYTMNSLVVGNTLQDQVMLEVTVAEINRTAMEQHGVDVRAFNSEWGGISQYGNTAPVSGTYPPAQAAPLFPVGLDGGISWAVVNLKEDVAVLFKQLQDENLARVLAEPKLLARSGEEANFLSGGEIPIVITQNQNTTIEFKEFGTKVVFVPKVREDGMIDLEVESEVSEPDFAAGVELFGFNVPAFITRRVDTDVSLADGESLIIAGLIKETKQEIESKMPFVGDIPFLGYFFRATEYKNEIKELVMVVRPRLVDPIEPGNRVSLPTDRGPLTRDEVKTQPTDAKVSRPRPW